MLRFCALVDSMHITCILSRIYNRFKVFFFSQSQFARTFRPINWKSSVPQILWMGNFFLTLQRRISTDFEAQKLWIETTWCIFCNFTLQFGHFQYKIVDRLSHYIDHKISLRNKSSCWPIDPIPIEQALLLLFSKWLRLKKRNPLITFDRLGQKRSTFQSHFHFNFFLSMATKLSIAWKEMKSGLSFRLAVFIHIVSSLKLSEIPFIKFQKLDPW